MLGSGIQRSLSWMTYYNKLESEVVTIRRDNYMNNYKQFRSDSIRPKETTPVESFESAPIAPVIHGLNVMNLSEDQWNSLKVLSKSTSYGDSCQFWNDEKALEGAQKRITLNGAPLRAGTNIQGQTIGRIPSGIMAGKLCILSGKILKDAGVIAPQSGGVVSVSRNDL